MTDVTPLCYGVTTMKGNTMMNLQLIKNSIEDAIIGNDSLPTPRTPEELAADVFWIIAVEAWEHTKLECVRPQDLLAWEHDLISAWAVRNMEWYVSRDKMMMFISDMREIFPGLSVRSAWQIIGEVV